MINIENKESVFINIALFLLAISIVGIAILGNMQMNELKENQIKLAANDKLLNTQYLEAKNDSKLIVDAFNQQQGLTNYEFVNLWLLTLSEENLTKFGLMDSTYFTCLDKRKIDYVQFSKGYLVTDYLAPRQTRVIYNLITNETVCALDHNTIDCKEICKGDRI